MSNDSIDTSVTSEIITAENSSPNANYSRWMTDMAADIAQLRLRHLALPGAHNSGVDQDGRYSIGEEWAICQYHDFATQLAAGARYLDLRLVDNSYKKDVGGSNVPNYRFVEVFEFKHGIISVGRRLETLVKQASDFSTANPGEIIILDFHTYDRGRNYSHSSLDRCLPYFNSIKDRLIPPSASNLRIGEIRATHPGCNIILCLNHCSPDNWPSGVVRKEQLWSPLTHRFTADATEENVTSLVTESMKEPPNDFWALSAAAGSPPIDLRADHPIRTEAFAPGRQNVNILMVDFISGANARISVVDRCIALCRQRGSDKSKPSAPSNLVVTTKNDEYDEHGYLKVNTLEFWWVRSTDNIGVTHYVIYQDGVPIATPSAPPYEHRNFHLKNYAFTVKAFDLLGNESEPSNTFHLIQDVLHPTMPEGFGIGSSEDTGQAYVIWKDSIDNAGIKGYQVYLDNQFLTFKDYDEFRNPSARFADPSREEEHIFKARAEDINGLFSEFGTFVIPARPNLINRRISVIGYDKESETYDACLKWGLESRPTVELLYHFQLDDGKIQKKIFQPYDEVSFNFQARQGQKIKTTIWTIFHSLHLKGAEETFVFDAPRPEPVSDLKITSSSATGASISWVPSTSTDVKYYAITVNEESPIFVLASTNTYTFEDGSLKTTSLIQVWAINPVDVPSTLEEIIFEPADVTPPSQPGTLVASDVTGTSATISWTASIDNVAVTGYTVEINGAPSITVTGLSHTFTGLKDTSCYVVVKAKDAAGNFSVPATLLFSTLDTIAPSQPGTPVASDITGDSALVEWPASSDNVKVTSYTVSLNEDPPVTVVRTGIRFSGLNELTSYRVEIRANDAAGNQSAHATLNFRTLDASTNRPTEPGSLTATNIDRSSALISWTASTGTIPVRGYDVIVTPGPTFFTQGTSHRLTDLRPVSSHKVEVRARNSLGVSSLPVSITFSLKQQ